MQLFNTPKRLTYKKVDAKSSNMSKKTPFELIEEVYNEHYRYLRHFLIGLTKSDEVADDIIQELVTKFLATPTRILKVNYMKSWLVKSA